MTIPEFSDQFDVLFNNITSNQAPGLNEYEKSLFLTKAEKETVKNHFTANSKGNDLGQGFDDSAKRQADFSVLMKTALCENAEVGGNISVTIKKYICKASNSEESPRQVLRAAQLSFIYNNNPCKVINGTYNVSLDNKITAHRAVGDIEVEISLVGFPYKGGVLVIEDETQVLLSGRLDDRSSVYIFPTDTFIVVNESIKTTEGKYLQVIPLRYNEYTHLMSKPFKRPLKNQAWRLMNSGEVNEGIATKYVEVITNAQDTIGAYNIRYVRTPKPIILADLSQDGLSIDGQQSQSTDCEIDPILHEEILQRAVELAKIAWEGSPASATQSGQRSE